MLAQWKLILIVGGLSAAIFAGAAAIVMIRSDIRKAAATDAAADINRRGATDVERYEAGRLGARECHARGLRWDLASGTCR